ncbi:MarR family transcriptional regulator [Streptantibioticus parmotrematis]|uniref:MarR family winged helix-turn-helix transcriptional regulator n=1 Tax=Streptantibioticus parmotrematis TaxID=2873249 RepID=UPI0033C70FD5
MSKRVPTATDRPPGADESEDVPAHGDAADEVVTAVLTASRLLVAVSARSLASVEETLTLPQFRMLVVLDTRGPMNISRLGEHLDVIPSTAMRMVDRLAAAGMLDRAPGSAGRREILISLTAAGRRVVGEATERRRAEIARIVGGMPRAQRAGLIEALQAFTRAGDEPLAEGGRNADVGW